MRGIFTFSALMLIVVMVAATVTASTDQWENRDKSDPDREDALLVVTGDDERISISMHDGSLLRITADDGDEQVVEFDLTLVEDILAEAMIGMHEALAELSDLNIEVQVDPHDSIVIGHGDETVVVDLQEIMTGVQQTLADTFEDLEIDFDAGIHSYSRTLPDTEDADTVDLDMLQDELDQLRQEVSKLRAELRRLQRD